MATCEKHGCPLTPLFTSAFCARCDEEAAVNAPVSSADADFLSRLEATLMESSDAAHANAMKGILGIGPGAQDTGWYHNYPVCGTDANGSDVDDMDVCMGLVVGDCVIVARDYMGNAGRIGTISHVWEDGCMCVGFDLDDSVFTHASNLRPVGDVKKAIYDAAYADWLASQDDAQPDVCMGLKEWMVPIWPGPGSVDFSAMEPRYRRLFLKRNPDARSHYREWRDGCARAAFKALQGR